MEREHETFLHPQRNENVSGLYLTALVAELKCLLNKKLSGPHFTVLLVCRVLLPNSIYSIYELPKYS